MAFKYELNSKVRDKISGYTGILTCRSEWLYGCVRYVIQAQELKDGKPVESIGVDEDQIELLDAAKPHAVKSTGGPTPSTARAPSQPGRR